MSPRKRRLAHLLLLVVVVVVVASACASQARAQQGAAGPAASSGDKPYMVEWVYKVKWGYADEFWRIFKKYQIATLNREKELGYVTSYAVYRPGHHMGEDSRWEYRIVITYKNISSSTHGSEVEKELFPDQATMKREENRRWELTEAHYDLPIHTIDPNGDGE
jgi:Ni/Co efflux regulator RcnB